jgi:uncharacterized protein YjbJ (UPF0337 family)
MQSRIAAIADSPAPGTHAAAIVSRLFFYGPAMCVCEQSGRVGPAILESLKANRPVHSKEITMNKDQIDGKLQDIGGKIQEEAGKLVGNKEQQAKGLANQVEGKTQEKFGDAKEVIKDATN